MPRPPHRWLPLYVVLITNYATVLRITGMYLRGQHDQNMGCHAGCSTMYNLIIIWTLSVCLSVCLFVCHPGRRGRIDAVGVVRPRRLRRPPACWRQEDRCSYVRTMPNAAALASRCTYTALADRALETAKQSRNNNTIKNYIILCIVTHCLY